MRVLVTGGAGYVGSVSVEALVAGGHEVSVLDDLSTGHRAAVVDGADLVDGPYTDADALARLLEARRIEVVLHCAARSLVAESIKDLSADDQRTKRNRRTGAGRRWTAYRATGRPDPTRPDPRVLTRVC